MKEVNVALIGYSFMGRAHSNAYRQVGPFMSPRLAPRMKVLCGRSPGGVKEAARRLGLGGDRHRLARGRPPQGHRPRRREHARRQPRRDRHRGGPAGKAVLCEKPLANTVREAEAMLAAVQKAGVVHMVCHNYRRAPAVMLAKKMIDSGQLGTIYHYRGTYLQDWILDPKLPLLWRFQKSRAGSGALGDIGSHSLDLARFLVGEITEVTGGLKTFIKERPLLDNPRKKGRVTVDDAAAAVVRFANGALGTIEGTPDGARPEELQPLRDQRQQGKRGLRPRADERAGGLLHVGPGRRSRASARSWSPSRRTMPYVKSWWPPGHIIGYEHTFTHTVYDLLEGIAKGRSPRPNFEDGVRNQKVLAAWEKAARTRRWERV